MLKILKLLLFATAFTPLIFGNAIFPHTFDKLIFFRVLVELAIILFFIHLLIVLRKKDTTLITHYSLLITKLLRNPIFLSLSAFFLSMLISAAFGINPYRAFWGDLERGEGFFGVIHYFLFFLLTLLVFNKKDWLLFFKLFCSVALIVSILSFIQLPYFNIRNLPPIIGQSERPSSLIGNAAYYASYLLFALIFSLILFLESKQMASKYKNILRYFSAFVFLIAVVSVFIAQTRGLFVGLAAAVFILLFWIIFRKERVFLFYNQLNLRTIALIFLGIIIVFSAIFLTTKNNNAWQKVPAFGRLAKTDIFNKTDASTAVRFGAWGIAWESFLEKPILGWGPESYLYLSNKNYDPHLSAYGDGLWLDRSHNKILDILSAQGIIGFLSYIGIFVAALFLVVKNQNIRFGLKSVFIGGITAYFVQNIFVFDSISSYIGFFALLGFLVAEQLRIPKLQDPKIANYQLPIIKFPSTITHYSLLITQAVIILIIVIVSYSMYAYNYTPYRQAYGFWRANKGTEDVNIVAERLKRAMEPYNFAQHNIRGKGFDLIYLDQYFANDAYVKNPKFAELGDTLLNGIRELIAKEPYDVRILIKTVEALNALARATPDKSEKLYKEAEQILEKAVVVSPKRQEVYYYIAFNLANQERFDESIQIARYAVDLSPEVPRAHYHLGLMYYLANQKEKAFEEFTIVEKIDSRFDNLMSGDINNLLLIYGKNKQDKRVAEMVKKLLDSPKPIRAMSLFIALKYYAGVQDKNNFIIIAKYLERRPEFENKEAIPILIELAEKGLWETINKSF